MGETLRLSATERVAWMLLSETGIAERNWHCFVTRGGCSGDGLRALASRLFTRKFIGLSTQRGAGGAAQARGAIHVNMGMTTV